MKNNELKPCPFCGGVSKYMRHGTPRKSCIVQCDDCGCELETGEEFEQSGDQWNTRQIEDSLKRQLTEAHEVIIKQHKAYEYLMTDISKRLDFGMPLKVRRDEQGIFFPWGHGVVIGLDQANEEAKEFLNKNDKLIPLTANGRT